jgi:galactose-1-phosphate uridylyltransferase
MDLLLDLASGELYSLSKVEKLHASVHKARDVQRAKTENCALFSERLTFYGRTNAER